MIALLIYAGEQASSGQPSSWHQRWFLAAFGVSAVLASAGAYVLAAVWLPLPFPATRAEREFQPRLTRIHASAERLVDGDLVFAIASTNAGRGNVDDAAVNVAVPAFFSSITRCSELGEVGRPEHLGASSQEPEALIQEQPQLGSIYWMGTIRFPGERNRIIYFRVTTPDALRDFPVRVTIDSPDLPKSVTEELQVDVSALPPRERRRRARGTRRRRASGNGS